MSSCWASALTLPGSRSARTLNRVWVRVDSVRATRSDSEGRMATPPPVRRSTLANSRTTACSSRSASGSASLSAASASRMAASAAKAAALVPVAGAVPRNSAGNSRGGLSRRIGQPCRLAVAVTVLRFMP